MGQFARCAHSTPWKLRDQELPRAPLLPDFTVPSATSLPKMVGEPGSPMAPMSAKTPSPWNREPACLRRRCDSASHRHKRQRSGMICRAQADAYGSGRMVSADPAAMKLE